MTGLLYLLRKLIKINGLVVGLICIGLSFLIWLVPARHYTFTVYNIFYFLFGLGIILVCDYADLKLSGSSLLINKKGIDFYRGFGVAAGLCGIVMDIFVQLLAKMWVFHKIPQWFYITFLFFGFVFYFQIVAESYFATKSILDRLLKRPKIRSINHKKWEKILRVVFIVSLLIIILSIVYYFMLYYLKGGFFQNFGRATKFNSSIFVPIAISFAAWGIAEFVAFAKKKNSLLKNCLRGYWRPLWVILLSCLWLGIMMELWNVPVQYWIYANVPFLDIRFLGIPIIILLLWPFHYIPFLSWYNVFAPKVPEDPWEIDRIKTP